MFELIESAEEIFMRLFQIPLLSLDLPRQKQRFTQIDSVPVRVGARDQARQKIQGRFMISTLLTNPGLPQQEEKRLFSVGRGRWWGRRWGIAGKRVKKLDRV